MYHVSRLWPAIQLVCTVASTPTIRTSRTISCTLGAEFRLSNLDHFCWSCQEQPPPCFIALLLCCRLEEILNLRITHNVTNVFLSVYIIPHGVFIGANAGSQYASSRYTPLLIFPIRRVSFYTIRRQWPDVTSVQRLTCYPNHLYFSFFLFGRQRLESYLIIDPRWSLD